MIVFLAAVLMVKGFKLEDQSSDKFYYPLMLKEINLLYGREGGQESFWE